MRTILRLIIPIQPRLLKEMRFETFIGSTLSRFTLVGHVVARIHKTVLIPIAPHRAVEHRTLAVDTAVPVTVVIGDDTMLHRSVEIGNTTRVRPVMPRRRAVMNQTFLQPCP